MKHAPPGPPASSPPAARLLRSSTARAANVSTASSSPLIQPAPSYQSPGPLNTTGVAAAAPGTRAGPASGAQPPACLGPLRIPSSPLQPSLPPSPFASSRSATAANAASAVSVPGASGRPEGEAGHSTRPARLDLPPGSPLSPAPLGLDASSAEQQHVPQAQERHQQLGLAIQVGLCCCRHAGGAPRVVRACGVAVCSVGALPTAQHVCACPVLDRLERS